MIDIVLKLRWQFIFHKILVFGLAIIILAPSAFAFQISNQDRNQVENQVAKLGNIIDLSAPFGIVIEYQGKTVENEMRKKIKTFSMDIIKSAFQTQSNFEITLFDLTEIESVWETSTEFNESKFEDLFSESKFSHLIVNRYNIYEHGLELSFEVFKADGQAVGSSIFSSNQILFPIPWGKYQEAQLLSAADSEELRRQVEALTNADEIVEDPSTFEEFYANYLILQSQNQKLPALNNLARAIELQPGYVDLIADITALSRNALGSDEGLNFLEKVVYPNISNELENYSKLLLDPSSYNIFSQCNLNTNRLDDCKIEVDEIVTIPLLNLFLKLQGERFEQHSLNWGIETVRQYNILQSARKVIESYKNGTFADFYFDKKRAASEIEIGLALDLEAKLNTAGYEVYEVQNHLLGSGEFFALPNNSDQNTYEIKTYGPLKFYSPSLQQYISISEETFAELAPINDMIGGAQDIIKFLGPRILGPCQTGRESFFQYGGDLNSFKKGVTFFWSEDEKEKNIDYYRKTEYLETNDRIEIISYLETLPILDEFNGNTLSSLFKANYYYYSEDVESLVNSLESDDLMSELMVESAAFKSSMEAAAQKYKYNHLELTSADQQHLLHLGKRFNVIHDRLLWADFCAINLANSQSDNDVFSYQPNNDNLPPLVNFKILGNLYITDQVDTTKPIIASFFGGNKTVNWSLLDISRDGTFFDPNGSNLDITQFIRGSGDFVLHKNQWLSAPGFIQSSIGMDHIDTIQYTDIYGNTKIVKPTKGNPTSVVGLVAPNVVDRNDELFTVFPKSEDLYEMVKNKSDTIYYQIGFRNDALFDEMEYHFNKLSKKDRKAVQEILLLDKWSYGTGLEVAVWNRPFKMALIDIWDQHGFDFENLSFPKSETGFSSFIDFINNYQNLFGK